MNRPPAILMGVPIADVTLPEAIQLVGDLVAAGRSSGRTHQIATANVDFLVNALLDRDVLRILQEAELCLADGMPIVWSVRALGMDVRERVAGADLVPALIDASQKTGWKVHVFGSAPSVAERATRLLRDRYPTANFSIDPGPVIDDVEAIDDEVLDTIAGIDADVLCVALGHPKQERFIRAHRERLGTPVMIGVGGSLDMLVGERRRAPRWAQRTGLEWVVRAMQEPRRLGPRYLNDLRVFIPAMAHELRASRHRRAGNGLMLSQAAGGVEARLTDAQTPTPEQWTEVSARLSAGDSLLVGNDGPAHLKDTALAHLVGLVRMANRGAGSVQWDLGTMAALLRATGDERQRLLVESLMPLD